jgi:probable phosphoglycerate mutase
MIRHALPVRVDGGDGPADPALGDPGRRQAQLLVEYLAGETIAALYTSTMRRAIQTAEPLGTALGLTVTTVDDLCEWDRAATTYLPLEELKAAGDPRFTESSVADSAILAAFTLRAVPAIEAIVERHPGERVAVICHGGVINVYLAHVLGLAPGSSMFFYPNYTSISRVVAARDGRRTIVTVNETSHLRNTGLPMGLFQKG